MAILPELTHESFFETNAALTRCLPKKDKLGLRETNSTSAPGTPREGQTWIEVWHRGHVIAGGSR